MDASSHQGLAVIDSDGCCPAHCEIVADRVETDHTGLLGACRTASAVGLAALKVSLQNLTTVSPPRSIQP